MVEKKIEDSLQLVQNEEIPTGRPVAEADENGTSNNQYRSNSSKAGLRFNWSASAC
jgi:hypothetical protein